MWGARQSDHLALRCRRSRLDQDCRQIGDGDLETGDRLNRHGVHACYRTGESDSARDRGKDRLPVLSGVVDTPVPGILTRGLEPGDKRAVDRRYQTDGGDGE